MLFAWSLPAGSLNCVIVALVRCIDRVQFLVALPIDVQQFVEARTPSVGCRTIELLIFRNSATPCRKDLEFRSSSFLQIKNPLFFFSKARS